MSNKELFIRWAEKDLASATIILKWSYLVAGTLVGSAIGLGGVGVILSKYLKRSAIKELEKWG